MLAVVAASRLPRPQRRAEHAHLDAEARPDKIPRHLRHRFENEAAQMTTRMRELQHGGIADFVSEHNQIEIERANTRSSGCGCSR